MLVFDSTWTRHHRVTYSYTQYINAIAVANTEVEALGLLLNAYPDTNSDEWKLTQIDIATPNVVYMDRGEY